MLEYLDMPRARTTTTEEETSVAPKKRAPRKRAAPITDGEAPVSRTPRAPRKRTSSVTEEEVTVASEREEVSRRAPTPLRAERKALSRGRRSFVWTMVFVVLLCGAGAAIGMSDQGQIDVVAVVNERNERINRGEVREGETSFTVPVQSTDIRPNGGLIPADTPTPPPTPEPAAGTSTTATSTPEETANSDTSAASSDTDTPAPPETPMNENASTTS